MRLERVSAKGLFGLFDHDIPLNLDERITILHAPNGYGKTAILKLISAFFGGSILAFRKVEFASIIFDLSDGSKITIQQKQEDSQSLEMGSLRSVTVTLNRAGEELVFDPEDPERSAGERALRAPIPSVVIEKHIPFLRRIGPRQYRDVRTDERLSQVEVIERYWSSLPPSIRRRRRQPEWLHAIRSSVKCRLIETQRLLTLPDHSAEFDDEPTLIPTVKTDSDLLAALIERTLAESATLSQTLDRTFPNRLLQKGSIALSEIDLRNRLASLEQRRTRLTEAGLLERSDESALIPEGEFDHSTRRILSEYVTDAEQKLQVYDDLLDRLEVLTGIINTRFQFKKLIIDRSRGFVFKDVKGRDLDLDSLSSGEQHQLVLAYDLIFSAQNDALLLIDEPEISLHIAWQKRFIPDLQRIIQLSPMDILVSTHSPQLIGSYIDLTVQLQGPSDDASISR